MAKRKAISKKLRFEIFKRDSFTCQYCGNTPPGVVLEVDHINPVKNGGDNSIDNLITSCFSCNRGKGAVDIKKIPPTVKKKLALIKEKEEQLNEYLKIIKKIERRHQRGFNKVSDVYNSYFEKYTLSDTFKTVSLRRFFEKLTLQEICDSMHTACAKIRNPDQAIKYFCGVCWNKIKDIDNG